MSEPSLVADYLEALSRELVFDPPLAARVRHEVRDHLCEAIAADPSGSPIDAARRAIDRFGDAREIAAPYKAASLYGRLRKTGVLVVLTIAAMFLVMAGRVAWYGLTQWTVSPEIKAASAVLLPVDRAAFLIAAALGMLAWLYGISRRVPTHYRRTCRAQLRRGQTLAASAAGAVAVAVTCEAFLTGLRLAETRWSADALVPALSIAAEIGLLAMIAIYIHNGIRRAAACRP